MYNYSIGKLSLYVAAAGIHPSKTLPIVIDVGTNNEELLKDPHYVGLRHKRVDIDLYNELLDEFLYSVKMRWPKALLQVGLERLAVTGNGSSLLTPFALDILLV